jgi:hypothetical protein
MHACSFPTVFRQRLNLGTSAYVAISTHSSITYRVRSLQDQNNSKTFKDSFCLFPKSFSAYFQRARETRSLSV